MINKKQITMKQPELGQKILELRKAKGYTQEELVDRCNINVRTIQRIEAGEVTPRMFTIKTILEALGYDFDAIQFQENNGAMANPSVKPNPILKTAFFVGISYFILAFIESFFDMAIWGFYPELTFNDDIISVFGYIILKLSVFILFSGFMLGFYRMASAYPNAIVKTAAVILAGLTFISSTVDCYSFYTGTANLFFLPIEAIAFGTAYIVFSIGIMKYRKVFGDLAFFSGLLGAVTGFCFMTLIFAIPGLILLTLFEILLLILLYRAFEYSSQHYTVGLDGVGE